MTTSQLYSSLLTTSIIDGSIIESNGCMYVNSGLRSRMVLRVRSRCYGSVDKALIIDADGLGVIKSRDINIRVIPVDRSRIDSSFRNGVYDYTPFSSLFLMNVSKDLITIYVDRESMPDFASCKIDFANLFNAGFISLFVTPKSLEVYYRLMKIPKSCSLKREVFTNRSYIDDSYLSYLDIPIEISFGDNKAGMLVLISGLCPAHLRVIDYMMTHMDDSTFSGPMCVLNGLLNYKLIVPDFSKMCSLASTSSVENSLINFPLTIDFDYESIKEARENILRRQVLSWDDYRLRSVNRFTLWKLPIANWRFYLIMRKMYTIAWFRHVIFSQSFGIIDLHSLNRKLPRED